MRIVWTRGRRLAATSAIGAVAIGLASGAGASAQPAARASSDQLTVLAAASLSKVFPKIDSKPRYTFGGSGMLQTEIQQGAPADVFAAASPKQTAALFAAGLAYKPVRFATNTLVMIVPKDNPA
ncbi:MAG TPA: substrate-binding domain-containing protein, partial [Solirubrobacteraceae bacterium]|nr:substrate-binding domain-containing protein [Solirubrobacteraceae bacterium]